MHSSSLVFLSDDGIYLNRQYDLFLVFGDGLYLLPEGYWTRRRELCRGGRLLPPDVSRRGDEMHRLPRFIGQLAGK